MEPQPTSEITDRDIQFDCQHCGNVLVVDRDGEGLLLDCPHCGGRVSVPAYRGDPRRAAGPASSPPAPAVSPGPGPGPSPATTPVPNASPAPVAAETAHPPVPSARRREYDFAAVGEEVVRKRELEVRQLLKENQSQRTEIQGYINQATIQLHRNQLKLRKLIERQGDFEAEMSAIMRRLGPPAASDPTGIVQR